MKVDNIESLGFADSAAVEFDVDQVPETHEEWAEAIGDLPFGDLFGPNFTGKALVSHPEPRKSHSHIRTSKGKGRTFEAPDMIPHFDGARWEVPPVITIIGCKAVDEGAPGTVIIDMAGLLEALDEDEFLQKNGVPPEAISGLQSVYTESTYHIQAWPYLRSIASEEHGAAMDKRLAVELQKKGFKNVGEFAASQDAAHPPKNFPFIQTTFVDEVSAAFLDGGVRIGGLEGSNGADYTPALHALRAEHLGNYPVLRERELARRIGWTANHCVAFPQIGTNHYAEPGTKHNRHVHIAFLAEAQVAAEWKAKQAT